MINHQVYLGLGSNLGNKEWNLSEAIRLIGEETNKTPREVLLLTQQIERDMGRRQKSVSGGYADRIIDIDILLYDDLTVDEPDLKIPHPLMHQRDFVMRPLKEIY